jgi:hypothetical protein
MSTRFFIMLGIVAALMSTAPLAAQGQTGVLHKQVPSSVVVRPLPSAISSEGIPSIRGRAAEPNTPTPTRGVPSLGHSPHGLKQAAAVAAPQASAGLEQATRATAKFGENVARAAGPMKAGQYVAKGPSEPATAVRGTPHPQASAEAQARSAAPEAIQRVGHEVTLPTSRWRDRLRLAKPFSAK